MLPNSPEPVAKKKEKITHDPLNCPTHLDSIPSPPRSQSETPPPPRPAPNQTRRRRPAPPPTGDAAAALPCHQPATPPHIFSGSRPRIAPPGHRQHPTDAPAPPHSTASTWSSVKLAHVARINGPLLRALPVRHSVNNQPPLWWRTTLAWLGVVDPGCSSLASPSTSSHWSPNACRSSPPHHAVQLCRAWITLPQPYKCSSSLPEASAAAGTNSHSIANRAVKPSVHGYHIEGGG